MTHLIQSITDPIYRPPSGRLQVAFQL